MLVTVMAFSGCATFGTKPWADRSPTEKALFFWDNYNSHFDATMSLANDPNITENQRQVVRLKKLVLKEFKTALVIYDDIVMAGGVPSLEAEQKLLKFIDRLVQAGGK